MRRGHAAINTRRVSERGCQSLDTLARATVETETECMDRDPATAKTRYWNIWWTLTMIAGAGTIVVAILEALGVFHDLGIALSGAGIILSVIFGVTASSRS